MNFFDPNQPVEHISAPEALKFLEGKKENEYCLLDVRQPEEFEKGRIPGSVLIPIIQLASRIDELDPDIPTIVYCAVGGRSHAGAAFLMDNGFAEVYNLRGGIQAWTGKTVTD